MVVVNKALFQMYDFRFENTLLLAQYVFSVVLFLALKRMRVVDIEDASADVIVKVTPRSRVSPPPPHPPARADVLGARSRFHSPSSTRPRCCAR